VVFDAGLGKHESDLTPKENDLFGKVRWSIQLCLREIGLTMRWEVF